MHTLGYSEEAQNLNYGKKVAETPQQASVPSSNRITIDTMAPLISLSAIKYSNPSAETGNQKKLSQISPRGFKKVHVLDSKVK